MRRKLLVAASVLIGLASFLLVLSFAGFESIIEPFRKFSLSYLILFLLISGLLYAVYTLRWYVVAKHQGINVTFLELFKLRLIAIAVSYLTPVSRMGGEPVRALLFKKKFRLEGKSAFSSIVLDSSIGMSLDILLITVVLVAALFFFTLPFQSGRLALFLAIAGSAIAISFYASLFAGIRPFSSLVRVCSCVPGGRLLKKALGIITGIEDVLIDFLHSRKKGMAEAVLISMLSWPLTFFQYKFALLAIGVHDVPVIIILLSIVVLSMSTLIPIPASFGVQEAGQFSVFSIGIIAMPGIGIALSLIIRLKDVLSAFIGLVLLSHEGLSIFEVFKKKG